ncbi:uncharacterized protein LOC127987129 isoform X1 [Carassius gibelio]|uniref:uncharacterized protein LOC127987129 isoform X1 n=2 Tax=Carassius gibelio TaxID=101364 RepID=UPI0022781193|nr:uncharacterized protein LOC127987129 isoform X1 [Carassius gibelio]
MKLFFCVLLLHGASGVGPDRVPVSVMEGESVTLHTDVKTNKRDRIRWYFNDTRIAQITGDLSKICTDVQCNEGTERFRDRLKLDHQTGSLTIMNTSNTDAGDYYVETIIIGNISEKIFTVTITGEAKTSGSDGEDEAPVLSAVKTTGSDQGSSNLVPAVRVAIILVVVAGVIGVVGVGVTYWHCKKNKPRRPEVLTQVLHMKRYM